MAENANVRVIINALTEAAEQNIDDVGDEISGLGDDAAIGQTALDQLSDEFGEATAQSMILQKAMSSLEDDMDDVARTGLYAQTAMDQFNDELTETTTQSTMASGALTGLQSALSGSAVGSKALSFAFSASLIPALMTLATVIAPVVALLAALTAGAVALAGAFGAIVGSGILAFGQKKAEQNKQELAQTERLIAQYESMREQTGSLTAAQQDRLDQLREKKKRLEDSTTAMGALGNVMSDLKDELVPIISEFGEQFIPLIEDALDAIPTLVRRMVDAVGGTEEFREALRDFGAAMMEVLPALTGFMFDLARDALPLAREFFSFLQSEGPDAMEGMLRSVSELEPEWRNLLDALIEMAPVLLEFGTNVAKIVLPALTALIRAATGFMETVNNMPGTLRGITISAMLLGPVLLKLASALSSILTFFTGKGILANLARLITYFSSAGSVTGALSNAVGVLSGALSSLVGWLTGTIAGAATLGAIIGLIGVKLLQVTGIMDMVGDAGSALGEALGPDLTSHLLTFLSVITLGIFPALAALGAAINELVQGDIDGAKQAVLEVTDIFASAFSTSIDAVLSALSDFGDILTAFFFNTLPSVVMGGLNAIWNGMVNFFTQRLPQLAIQGLGAFVALVEQQFNRVFNFVADIWNALIEYVAGATEKLINAGIDAINSFLSTLDDVGDKIGEIPGVSGVDVGTLDEVSVDRDIGQVDRRETDYGTLREQRTQQAQQVIQGGINVSVDARGDVQDNPYQWSRRAAQQLQRETRQQYGASR